MGAGQPRVAVYEHRRRSGIARGHGDGKVLEGIGDGLAPFPGQLPVEVLIGPRRDDPERDYEPGGQAHRPEYRGQDEYQRTHTA